MPVQLITDKTNAPDLSSDVFAVLICVTRIIKKWLQIHCQFAIPHISLKTGKQGRNKGSIELYCLFTAADSVIGYRKLSGIFGLFYFKITKFLKFI